MQTNKISQKIKYFELINSGIDEALIDVSNIKLGSKNLVCTIAVYEDDFSSKAIYKEVAYPRSLLKNI